MLWSIILLPITLLDEGEILSTIFGLPILFFIPGYILVYALFLTKTSNKVINILEMITLSFIFSIAVVSIIGFILNFTPMGIQLESILLFLFVFVNGIGTITLYRWFKTLPDERFFLSLDFSKLKSEKKLDRLLTIMIITSLILATSSALFITTIPQRGEPFTEFYLFDSSGKAKKYPTNLTRGLNNTVSIEIENHEYKTINYTIDIWLIRQSTNNGIMNWTWDFGDGNFEYGGFVTHQYAENGSYNVNLTVKDNDNVTTFTEQTVLVGLQPPVAWFVYEQISPSATNIINFTSASTDYDGTIVNWTWEFGDDSIGYGEFVTHQYAENGSYHVNLTVKDDDNVIDRVKRTVFIGNQPPIAEFIYEPSSLSTSSIIYFNSTSIDPDASRISKKTIIRNMWFLHKITITLQHSNIDIGNLSPPQWQHNYSFTINRTGSFKLAFLLFTTSTENYISDKDYKDKHEIINEAYRELHLWMDVYDRRPIANFTYFPENPTIEEEINFTTNSLSPYSDIIWWKWDFGDGNTSGGETIGLRFDGKNDYIDCGNNSILQPVNGTIEAWILIRDSWGVRRIFTGSTIDLRRHPAFYIINNRLGLVLTNNRNWDGHIYEAKFRKEIWYHVGATWDGVNVSFYVNGSLKQINNQSVIPAGNNDSKRIGGLRPPYAPQVFSGNIRDVRIYNRSLNNTEIQSNYIGNITTNGLISWWKMNNSGNIVNDHIGNNNGTLYGAEWINQARHRYNKSGTYQVKLTISNEYGQINSISKNITISSTVV